ncbi:MAG: nucleotide sugar dehydrogenase [Rhabdochlamydiaceae bacterium]|jgi:UDPglucose 6-dehydrogenase
MQVSVIGLGKLGAPLLAVLASRGHEVIGIDINADFVEKINRGMAPVEEPLLQELISTHRLKISATSRYREAILATDITFVIVPTPSGREGLFSNRYLLQAVESLGEFLKEKSTYHLVVITSTTVPGSAAGEIKNALEHASGRTIGNNLGLCYSPEFVALGSVVRNMLFPDMILIGESDKRAGDLLESIYRTICENTPPIRRMNLVNAELAKIAINTFVTTKISYANMLSDICQRLPDADVDTVTEAVGLDSRIGNKYLRAAVAFGGPCFPRDNIALRVFAEKIGARADLAQATQEINQYQLQRLVDLIEQNTKTNRIGILGLSYKAGTYVVEESPGIAIANHLSEKGYTLSVYDPVALIEAKKNFSADIQATSSVAECLQRSDTVLIMTPWPEFSQAITPELLAEMSPKIIIDPWRLLPSIYSTLCDLIYLGRGTENLTGTLDHG